MNDGARRVGVRFGLSLLGVAAAIAVLQLAGRGDLATPPLRSWSAFRTWLEDRDGITAAFAILRLVALMLAWYAAVALAVGAIARLTGSRRLVAIADRATVPPVRRLLAGMAGAGLASAATLSVAPAVIGSMRSDGEQAVPAGGGAGERLVLLPDGETATDGERLTLLPEDEGTATMRRLPAASMWTVEPGDHFWCIAETSLAEAWGRPPTDAEIVPFWNALIELNRHRLVHPDNPDLVFPGQVFEIPQIPPAG